MRHRDTEYLRWLRSQPCVVCGAMPCEAHHVRLGHGGGMGYKPGDDRAVSLCHFDHASLHSTGEQRFFLARGIYDPAGKARQKYEEYTTFCVDKAIGH